ncbi:hypothetical protein OH77DRAFT_1409911 [Trametes cingulata]|nr:hypothetical protein OH77DRAFT_1409911 [Trametes cingulata]
MASIEVNAVRQREGNTDSPSVLQTFETALKDVLMAKRLSQSKMSTLTDIALKCMDNDVQMVSLLYRTQKGLSPSAKGSNLYVIDALARAARHRVVKQNITGDLASGKGNCATFLLRIEGILDGLFQDLLSTHSDELKEKAKKILDIWTKQNTFPSAVLSPLYLLLKDAGNDKGAYDLSNRLAKYTFHAIPFTCRASDQKREI